MVNGSQATTTAGGKGPAGFDQLVLRLRLIGPMAAWTLEPLSVLPPGRKTRALLAILALAMPRGVSRARLAEMLWSGRPEEQSRASLRQELHRLQEALAVTGAELLQVNRDQVGLKSGLVWVDTSELFEASHEHPAALVLMDREFLEGMDGIDPVFDQWLAEQRERLRLRARDLAEGLLADITDPDMAMMAAQRLLSIDNAHEGAWRALIRSYALRGEHGMAIQAYERCKAALAEHLGASPSPETARLVTQIRGGRTAPELPRPPHAQVRALPPSTMVASAAGGPRVGVLPPRLLGEGRAMLPVAIGLADEITGALTRCRWFITVSSAAVQRFARTGEDERTIRAVLGIDYLLDGTLQHAGNRVRIAVRLIDLAAEQDVIWADRFEGDVDDLFAMQDRLAAEIAARVESAVLAAEGNRAPADPARPTQHLRAVPLMLRFERADFDRAGQLLAEAITSRPDRADIYSWYSLWHVFALAQGWIQETTENAGRALALAERAQALDPLDARGIAHLGLVRSLLFRQPREALALYERAQLINPNFPEAWGLAAYSHVHLGELDDAERLLAECKRLAPLHAMTFLFDTVGMLILLLRRDFEATVRLGLELTELHPGYVTPHVFYLAALGNLGQLGEAARLLLRVFALKPNFCIERIAAEIAVQSEDHRSVILEGLRLAGVPEEAP